jgi:hypothetical protein
MAFLLSTGEICNMVTEACLARAARNLASGGGTTVVADRGSQSGDRRMACSSSDSCGVNASASSSVLSSPGPAQVF